MAEKVLRIPIFAVSLTPSEDTFVGLPECRLSLGNGVYVCACAYVRVCYRWSPKGGTVPISSLRLWRTLCPRTQRWATATSPRACSVHLCVKHLNGQFEMAKRTVACFCPCCLSSYLKRSRSWCMFIWWGMLRNSRTWHCSLSVPSRKPSRWVAASLTSYNNSPLHFDANYLGSCLCC